MKSRYCFGGIVAMVAIGALATLWSHAMVQQTDQHLLHIVGARAAHATLPLNPQFDPMAGAAGIAQVQYVAPWQPEPIGEIQRPTVVAPTMDEDGIDGAVRRPLAGYRGFANASPNLSTSTESLPFLDVVGQPAMAHSADPTGPRIEQLKNNSENPYAERQPEFEVVEGRFSRGRQCEQGRVITNVSSPTTICESCMGNAGCQGSEQTRILEGVEDNRGCGPEKRWTQSQPLAWELFGPGEYIGPVRKTPVQRYRIRVDDVLNLIYFLSRDEIAEYRLQIGDRFKVESDSDAAVSRTVEIMPDGRVSLHLLGYVHVAGRTIPEVVALLNEQYVSRRLLVNPRVTVTGESVNTRLRDIQSTVQGNVTGQAGANIGNTSIGTGGIQTIVGPDGRINLVGLSSMVCCQGLTVSELQHEINARYREEVPGLNVNVALQRLAPKSVFVVGEVASPGRYVMEGPTRVSQALALAGGARVSGNQREIVIVRHTTDWGVIATKVDLRGFLLGKRPIASDDLWIRDRDIVVVPRGPIQRVNDVIRMLFTDGVYAVVPELGGFTTSNVFGTGTLLGN